MKSTLDQTTKGWVNGGIGMLIFSGTLPATRVGVDEFGASFMTSMRAVVAGVISLGLLMLWPRAKPSAREFGSLCLVAFGVVLGFPLLTGLALRHVTAAHAMIFIGLLPLCTAIGGFIRNGECPRPAFWVVALLGSMIVTAFAPGQERRVFPADDALMVLAIVVCGLGYAEGARLARHLGAWQVIAWALVISLPISLPFAVVAAPPHWTQASSSALLGLGYVCVFSMLLGFIFWYRGLAQGGVAAVGQLQLLQPFFGLLWAAVLLDEPVTASMFVAVLAVVICVLAARRLTR